MFFNNIKKFIDILGTKEKNYFLIFSILLFIAAILEFMSIGLIIPFAIVITDSSLILNNSFVKEHFSFINSLSNFHLTSLLLILFCIIYFLKFIFFIILTTSKNRFLFSIKKKIQIELFKGYLTQPYIFHTNKSSSILINNITNNVNLLVLYACQGILEFLSEIVLSIFIISLLLIYEPKGAIFVFSIGFIFISIYFTFSKKKSEYLGENKKILDQQIVKEIQQSFNGIKEVLIYQKEYDFIENFKDKINSLTNLEAKFANIIEFPRHFLEFIAVICFVFLLFFLLNNDKETAYIISVLSLFGAATFKLIPSINRMVVAYSKIRYNFSIINDLSPDLVLFKKQSSILNVIKKNKLPFNLSLELKNIDFAYGQKKIFKNLNAKFYKGEVIGILGESGTGKSTLINLISGLLIPDKGNILVDNIDVSSNLFNWRSNISYIPQSIYLIDDTLKNNVAFFENSEIDSIKYKKALKDAQLSSFVNNLKNKDLEIVGERGAKISGGQMQRIALARALYKEADLFILDEATNALDEANEEKILEIISKLKKDKLIIIISHNKKTLKICDKIFSINNMELKG